MAAGELLPPRRTAPHLELRRVVYESTARDLAVINGHAYGMPPELFECICNLHLWHEDSFGYAGYAEGRAVSAAATFPVDGTAYVALVATMPDAHGKSYAETGDATRDFARGLRRGAYEGPTKVAVGTIIADRPPHRSVRAALPHTAPTLDIWRQNERWDRDGESVGEAASA